MEPCGGLPVSTVVVLAHFCHHHMAWHATVELRHQDGQEPALVSMAHCAFGPFDRYEDVLSWIDTSLRALQPPPSGPGW